MKYGRKLTQQEFEKQIIELYNKPVMFESTVRRVEMELMIDHALGVDYPVQKRAACWLAYDACNSERLRLASSMTWLKKIFPWYELVQVHSLFRYGRKQLAFAMGEEDVKIFLDEGSSK